MLNFSYTLSPTLKKEIENIETTRNLSLVVLLSPREELLLQWEAAIERVFATQDTHGHRLKHAEITRLFLPQIKKTQVKAEKLLIDYKRLHDKLFYTFSLSSAPLTGNAIKTILADLGIDSKKLDIEELKRILSFIQVNPEHPVVQAGLSYILFSIAIPPLYPYTLLPVLIAEIFLYKYGFDMKRMLVLENYFLAQDHSFPSFIEEAKKTKNLSRVLEYFTEVVSVEAIKTLKIIQKKEFKTYSGYAESFKFNDRQKEILSYVARPGTRITNKDVQKLCGVSQITASRELALLSSLGLLFTAGKGRSVYYTKV